MTMLQEPLPFETQADTIRVFLVDDHPIVRLYRDVRLFRLYEGTSQIHQVNIARHLMRGDH